jgi:hypothetical protein
MVGSREKEEEKEKRRERKKDTLARGLVVARAVTGRLVMLDVDVTPALCRGSRIKKLEGVGAKLSRAQGCHSSNLPTVQ